MDATPGKPTPKAPTTPSKKPQDSSPKAVSAPSRTQEATQLFSDTVPVPSANQKITPPSVARSGDAAPTQATPSDANPATKADRSAKTQPRSQDVTDLLAHETGKAGKTERIGPLAATGKFTESNAEDPTQLFRESAAPPARSPKAAASLPPDQVFGDFRLDKKLGEGGMGAVYKAHQISMDRTVALKMLSKNLATNQDFVARFKREAQTMAKVDHPNIVRGYAVGEVDGQHFVAMEFIDGQSMQKWMDKLGKFAVEDAVHVVLCSAYALQHAHEQSLVHRDIKPDNILINSKGVVKVADLGLAKKTDDNMSLTQSGTGFGTPYYMPLEQYRDAKRVDARADIYALGVTLYYLLTGKLPYYGETHFDVIKAKEAAKFIPARRHNPEIPERLDLMIDKMIQKERSHRYQSCADLIEALESLGLASEFPSFIGTPAPISTKKGAAPTVRASTLPTRSKPSAAASPAQETPDLWMLRYMDERGQKVKKQVSSGRLKQLIERDEIDLPSATVVRTGEENQRPLGSVQEFSSLVQSKMVKAKADRRSQKLDTAYAKLERDAKRQRIFKAIKNFFRNVTSVVILLAVIAALIVGAWWLFRNKDTVMQKVQDAAKSVQDSAGSGGPSASPEQKPQATPAP